MKSSNSILARCMAGFLVMALLMPAEQTARAQALSSDPSAHPAPTSSGQGDSARPSASKLNSFSSGANNSLPDSPTPSVLLALGKDGQSGSGLPASSPQQDNGSKPVGTAAAPYEKPTGVAASRPAGAVIAPAKQRRVRTILISLGVVIGAGVAIGTVAGLSKASPSRP